MKKDNDINDAPKSRRAFWHPYLGERLKSLMRLRGITSKELAQSAETSPNMISQITTGRSGITLELLPRLAGALNVEPETITFDGKLREDEIEDVNAWIKVMRKKNKVENFNYIQAQIREAAHQLDNKKNKK